MLLRTLFILTEIEDYEKLGFVITKKKILHGVKLMMMPHYLCVIEVPQCCAIPISGGGRV